MIDSAWPYAAARLAADLVTAPLFDAESSCAPLARLLRCNLDLRRVVSPARIAGVATAPVSGLLSMSLHGI